MIIQIMFFEDLLIAINSAPPKNRTRNPLRIQFFLIISFYLLYNKERICI